MGSRSDIVNIFCLVGLPAIEVVMGVVAGGMAFFDNTIYKVRVFFCILTDTEKSGMSIVFAEFPKCKIGSHGVGAIVEGNIY